MQTFKDRLDAADGFGPGFALMRLVLASGVVAWHATVIVNASEAGAKASPLWLFAWALVPMFFVLSGFLVTKSALRLPVREYLLNRVVRIMPALSVDVVACALIIGPLFTSLALGDYVRDPAFARYFLNIFGWVHYFLPGVFENNRIPLLVNGSLWTVPYELACYLVLGAMVSVGLLRRARWALLLGLGWLVVAALIVQFAVTLPGLPGKGMGFLFTQYAAKLVPFFLAGSAIYLAQGRIPFDWRIAAGCAAALLVASLALDGNAWFASPWTALLAWAPVAYLVIFLGLSRLPNPPTVGDGDYSYGIYLYHFPLLQVIDSFYRFEAWWQLLLAAVLPVLGLAMFSWHVIERPALAWRRRYSLVGARAAVAETQPGTAQPTTSAPVPPQSAPRARSQSRH